MSHKLKVGIFIGILFGFVGSFLGCDVTDPEDAVFYNDKRMDRHEEDGNGGGGSYEPTSARARFYWTAPSNADDFPGLYYIGQRETDGVPGQQYHIGTDTFHVDNYDFDHTYRERVAGVGDVVDSLGVTHWLQGPWSSWSDEYHPTVPGPDPEINFDPILAYYPDDMATSNVLMDWSGYDGRHDLLFVADTTLVNWVDDGIEILPGGFIYGESPKLYEFAKGSGEISVELEITPGNLTQSGPARLFTCSLDPYNRNFTFGQDGGNWDIRFRTTTTSDNGIPSTQIPATLERTKILFTRGSDGTVTIYINDSEVLTKNIGGDISNWNDQYLLAIGDEFGGGREWSGIIHRISVYAEVIVPQAQTGLKEPIREDKPTFQR